MNENNLIQKNNTIQLEAARVLETLQLIPLWKEKGCQPYLVGALAYDLALAPDIDMEIFCQNPKIEDGFEILKRCAIHPGCISTRFRNEMNQPDQGYYWQIKFQQPEGRLWKIDMWSISLDYPGPTSRDMIVPIRNALDNDKRETILILKQAILNNPNITCPLIFLYQAVIADGVHTFQELLDWLAHHDIMKINDWHRWIPGNS